MTDGTDGNAILLGNNGAHIYIDQYQLEIGTAYGQNLSLSIGGGAKSITLYDTSGNVNINADTVSTSPNSGALTVDGGVGIKKNLYVGQTTTMKFQASDPTAPTGGVTVYTKNADLGNTGIYYVNSTTSGELVSKKKALAYSIVFG